MFILCLVYLFSFYVYFYFRFIFIWVYFYFGFIFILGLFGYFSLPYLSYFLANFDPAFRALGVSNMCCKFWESNFSPDF